MRPVRPLLVAAKVPEDMTQIELLAYSKMLEQQVEHQQAEMERIKSDAIVTIALLVHQMGDEAILMPNAIDEIQGYQYARELRAEDKATIFRLRKKVVPYDGVANKEQFEAELAHAEQAAPPGDEPEVAPG